MKYLVCNFKNKLLKDEILKYSMQIAMLKQLLRKELINEKEYEKKKKKLMEEYKIYERI